MFALAYRMLGVRADAEDVVQDAYLRWQSAASEEIRSSPAYLTTVTARLALDALKSAHRKREIYVGPWLPEPIVEPLGTKTQELAESLSMAFLQMLESLTPAERVAFLLREVFDTEYQEIAATLETTEANSRQLVARARKHVRSRGPKFRVDPAIHKRVLEQFLAACTSGDPSQLASLLAEDVVHYADGGGKAAAAMHPIEGRDRVSRLLTGLGKRFALGIEWELVEINGETGIAFRMNGTLHSLATIQLNEEGKISGTYFVVNPEKLPHPKTNPLD